MSEGKYGTCRFCGQSKLVTTVGDVSQSELDMMVTDSCDCPDAKSDRRVRERKKKKDEYLESFSIENVRQFMQECLDAVDKWDSGIKDVQVRLDDGWTHKIYLNKDSDLKIKTTKKNEEETTI